MELKNKIYQQLLERGSNEILLVIVRSIIMIIISCSFRSLFAHLLKFFSFYFYCKKSVCVCVCGGGGGGGGLNY